MNMNTVLLIVVISEFVISTTGLIVDRWLIRKLRKLIKEKERRISFEKEYSSNLNKALKMSTTDLDNLFVLTDRDVLNQKIERYKSISKLYESSL